MKLNSTFLMFLVVLFFSLRFEIGKGSQVNWLGYKLPGCYAADGSGICYQMSLYSQKTLNQYQHLEIRFASVERIIKFLSVKSGAINVLSHKTPFPPDVEKNMYRSNLVAIIPPPGFVMRKADYRDFIGSEKPSIDDLFESEKKKPTILWAQGATFHPLFLKKIEQAMADPKKRDLIYEKPIGEDVSYRHKMLLAGRVDAYPDHIFSYSEDLRKGNLKGKSIYIVFKDVAKPVEAYSYVSKSDEGKKFLKLYNKMLKTPAYFKRLSTLYDDFFPENLSKKYKELLRQRIGK